MKTLLTYKTSGFLLLILLVGTIAIGSLHELAPALIVLAFFLFFLLLRGITNFQALFFLSIPLSFYITLTGGKTGIMFPSEPLLAILCFFSIIKILTSKNLTLAIFDHAVSFSLLILWTGLVIATIYSNIPVVSGKALFIFTLFIIVFYYQWILNPSKETLGEIDKMLKFYFIGLLIVATITIIKHASLGFERASAMNMPPPFFSDHTLYGCCLAFFIPIIVYWYKTSSSKLFYSLSFIVMLLAIYLTFSRAVWMSLLSVLVLNYILYLKISFKRISITLISILLLFFLFQDSTLNLLSNNNSDSKARKAEVSDQLKSVTNISSDVSNLERINRWKSAWIMFSQKPLTGYGPGTYQFNFIPFQRDEDKTKISVSYASNRFSQGMGGTAHSQYLLFASESGVIVILAFIAVLFFTLKAGFTVYYESSDEKEKMLVKALLGGYVTFVFHSFFNNFLDIDKAAALFFLFNAAIVIVSIVHKKNKTALPIEF